MDGNILDIEYWDYDDGSVGAKFTSRPDGDIWAKDEQTLFAAMVWLCNEVKETEKKAERRGAKQRKMDIGMQGQWIDGRFTIRFLPMPGFGISFTAQENLKAWLKHLVEVMGKPQTTKTYD